MHTIAAVIMTLVALGGATVASADVIDVKAYFPNPRVARTHDLSIDTVTCWTGFPIHFKWVSDLHGSDGSVFSMWDPIGGTRDYYVWADNYIYSVFGTALTSSGTAFSTGAPFTRTYRRLLDLNSLPLTEQWYVLAGAVLMAEGSQVPVTPIPESVRALRIETHSDGASAADCNPSVAHGRTSTYDASTGQLRAAEDFWISDHVPVCGRAGAYEKGLRRFQHHEYGWASPEACVEHGGVWHGNGHCQTVDVLLCWTPK